MDQDFEWLAEIVEHGPGWDGGTAPAISQDIYDHVVWFYRMCMIKPDYVGPDDDGTVVFLWFIGHESGIEVKIEAIRYTLVKHSDLGIDVIKRGSIDALLDDGLHDGKALEWL